MLQISCFLLYLILLTRTDQVEGSLRSQLFWRFSSTMTKLSYEETPEARSHWHHCGSSGSLAPSGMANRKIPIHHRI